VSAEALPCPLGLDPDPGAWPVLVTGAGGFVGGHVARRLAGAGHRVRGLTRRPPFEQPGDPAVDWIVGDLHDRETRGRALAGVRGVIHAAAWVSLGRDRRGTSRAVNVDATRLLLDEARRAGVERFVLTSTLHTLAAGTPETPADEDAPWNLSCVDSPYSRTKREAEAIVRAANESGFTTIVLCPGMVLGPRDPKPTSTLLLRTMARHRVVVTPGGGIPIVDASVVALAHRRALIRGEPGARYAVVGEYLGYADLARLSAQVVGRPRVIVGLPDLLERPVRAIAEVFNRLGLTSEFSGPTVAGGFLRLHVSGARADRCFGLVHPAAVESVRSVLANPGGGRAVL
jgi:dihydroflavonol-4-reductase